MPMNMMEKKKLGQFLVKNPGKPVDESQSESVDDISEDAALKEMMVEFCDAVNANKVEKAMRAFKMMFKVVYDETEEEEDKYDGMKFAESND
jgi:hypothetical protein